MPYAKSNDGVELYYEERGTGVPILFIHEFADDFRAWDPQVRLFGRWYRCITYNARGYPPSAVPDDVSRYSQARAVADAVAVLDHLSIEKAHIVGLSMGGFCTLHFGLTYPKRALSLLVAGCGYGAQSEKREQFRQEALATAQSFEDLGMEATADQYSRGPTRVQFQNKDEKGWADFRSRMASHSALGSALTMRGVQAERPSLYDLRTEMTQLDVPTLIVTGDEDEPCLEPALMMKRTIAASALVVFPRTGHACNLEEPDLFNRTLHDFLSAVDNGRWLRRDDRSVTTSITGMSSP